MWMLRWKSTRKFQCKFILYESQWYRNPIQKEPDDEWPNHSFEARFQTNTCMIQHSFVADDNINLNCYNSLNFAPLFITLNALFDLLCKKQNKIIYPTCQFSTNVKMKSCMHLKVHKAVRKFKYIHSFNDVNKTSSEYVEGCHRHGILMWVLVVLMNVKINVW